MERLPPHNGQTGTRNHLRFFGFPVLVRVAMISIEKTISPLGSGWRRAYDVQTLRRVGRIRLSNGVTRLQEIRAHRDAPLKSAFSLGPEEVARGEVRTRKASNGLKCFAARHLETRRRPVFIVRSHTRDVGASARSTYDAPEVACSIYWKITFCSGGGSRVLEVS